MRIKDVDVPAVLDALQKRYPSGRAVCKITALRKENPDLSEQLQAIDANAGVLWGESLKDRLLRLGVFDEEGSAVKPVPAAVPAPVIAPVPIPGAHVPAAEAAAPVPPAAHGIQLLYELFSNDPVLTAEVTLLNKRITALTGKLDEAYPDLDISGFRQAHKKWGEAAGEISKRLRFSSGDDFIRAMGYTIHTSKGGRPTNNVDEVLDEIRRRYPNGVANLTVLREENPDLGGKIKTLVNNAGKLWGMSLSDYLTSIGILQDNNEEAQRQKEEVRRKKEEEDARQLREKSLALLDELRSLCGAVPVLMDSDHLQQQQVLLDWRSLKKYRRTATSYDSMDDFLQAEGIIRIPAPQEALDHLTAELKKRLNNKPFTGGIRALKSKHADLPYSLAAPALTDKGVSLQDYLISQGILPDAETERRMRYVTPDEAMFMSYFSNEVNVVVPGNIKYLKKRHFAGCTMMESIHISSTVETVEHGLFAECPNLKRITVDPENRHMHAVDNCLLAIDKQWSYRGLELLAGCAASIIPEDVRTINQEAFAGCTGLKTLHISKSVEYIEDDAFTGCHGLEEITVHPDNEAFYAENNCLMTRSNWRNWGNRNGRTLIRGCPNSRIPANVTRIGSNAFSGCTELTRVTLPEGLETIERRAFAGCTRLESVDVPSTVTYVGPEAFADTPWLAAQDGTLIVNDALYAFDREKETMVVPQGVKTIANLFRRADTSIYIANPALMLTEVVLPDTVETIMGGAFEGCKNLQRINLPDSIKQIGRDAFSKVPAVITLPAELRLNKKKSANDCQYVARATLSGRDMADLLAFQSGAEWDSLRQGLHYDLQDTLDALTVLARRKRKHTPVVLTFLLDHRAEFGAKACPVFEAFFSITSQLLADCVLAQTRRFFEEGGDALYAALRDCVNNPGQGAILSVVAQALPPHPFADVHTGDELCSLTVGKKERGLLAEVGNLLFRKKSVTTLILADGETKVPSAPLLWLLTELACCRSVTSDVKRVVQLLDQDKLTDFLWSYYRITPNAANQSDITPILWMLGHVGGVQQVSKMLSDARDIAGRTQVDPKGTNRGRNGYAILQSIAYNDSSAVLLMLDKRGELSGAARVRGLDEEFLRARLLAATDTMLDAGGTYLLDYGVSQYQAILNPDMTISFKNVKTGKLSKSLPKPSREDDPALAAAAADAVKELKINVRNIAGQRTKTVQHMLYTGMPMSCAVWKNSYLSSVILRTLAGGILWGVYDDQDTLLQPFCLEADGSLRDANGAPVSPQDDDRICVVDASQMSPESVDAWRTYFWSKGTKAVVRQFESPGRYVTPELAEARYDGLTVPIGYAKNALNLQGFEGSRTADINGSFIHVDLHATWGEEEMEISHLHIDRTLPPYGQMTDHQKRLWNRDILRLDSVLHPEKRLEVIVARGDVGEIKLCVENHLITGDNITDMVGLVIQHKRTEATAYLMQLKQDWIGEVQDPFSQFTLDF